MATNLAYPLGDLSIIAVLIAILTITGRRAGATWWLAGLGFAVFAVADTIYLVQAAQGTYREFTLLDTIWPAAFTLIAFAAWQPARRLGPRHRHSSAMLAPPAVLALVALGLLLVDHYSRLNALALWLAAASVCAVVLRLALTFRENLRVLRAREAEAVTDQLTGLGNRRALLQDLDRVLADHEPGRGWVLALFDLDGFKAYNDAYGHPAGDALLERLGANLAAAVGPQGQAYRMGGDEFCVLAPLSGADPSDVILQSARRCPSAASGSAISCSHGMALLPAEGTEPSQLLSLADQRMYADKREGRPGGDETVGRVLMHLLGERDDALHDHVGDVADLAERVGERLELPPAEIRHLRWAASLHDIGKVAIPDAILHAPRPLEPAEWDYIRRHTVIGARIIGAAPGLEPVAAIVRASHERWDGRGYPDSLAGTAIPLGARIVAVCDAYDAMTADRPYRTALGPQEALAELRRCAGGQFDPAVVLAFEAIVAPAAAAA